MASECESGATPSKKRPRSANWTELEKISLVEKVLQNEGDLFGNFKAPSGSKRGREEIWGEITDAVNAESNQQRTTMQMKKQYDNMKQIVKKYIDAEKFPKTGNAPAPFPLIGSLKLLYDNTGGKPGMSGIPGGIDTEDSSTLLSLVEDHMEQTDASQTIFSFITETDSSSTPLTCMLPQVVETSGPPNICYPQSAKKKPVKKYSAEDSLFEAEKRRAEVEIEKLKEEVKLLKMRRIYEKRKLIAETNYWKSKTSH